MILEHLRPLANRAHQHTSFDPEKRGESLIKGFSQELSEDLEKIESLGGDVVRYKEKYISLLSAWLSSKSNCYSVMITGPANFNPARHEKRNNAERNKYEKFVNWRDKVLKAIVKANTESSTIVRGESDTIQKLQTKLESLEKYHSIMKTCNSIIKDKKDGKTKRLVEAGLTEKQAEEIQKPDYMGRVGFAPFNLQNSNAQINKLKKDIEAERQREQVYEDGDKEYEIEGVKVIENVSDNRIRLFFDGKPDQEMIKKLKGRGFRWSPSNMAWQRQLTRDAVYAAKNILSSKQ